MPVKILLVTVKLNVSEAEYQRVVSPLISAVLDVPGLRWKIWLMNAAQCAAGGIYLFDDEPSAQAFLAGPVMAGLKDHPSIAGLSAQQFDVMELETALTHGPVGEGVAV